MNIFYLDKNPYIAALYHGDKHMKMLLEIAQMLSTAHRVTADNYFTMKYCEDNELYKTTHANHPCSIWVRENIANYNWAWKLFDGLCMEFRLRRGKDHASKRLLYPLKRPPTIPFAIEHTAPPLAMPDEFKTDDPVESYRAYYRYKYANGIVDYKWSSKRQAPEWLFYQRSSNNEQKSIESR